MAKKTQLEQSKRFEVWLKPSVFKSLRAIADKQGKSAKAISEKLIEDYVLRQRAKNAGNAKEKEVNNG